MSDERARQAAALLITFLETGKAPDGLFSADVFCDFTLPRWRLQARGEAEVLEVRRAGHPAAGAATLRRFDPTPTGFVLEVEEEWVEAGETWYCRELFRADTEESGAIRELAVYCTGDWDRSRRAQHAREVTLLRP